jgi:hypothetical protein
MNLQGQLQKNILEMFSNFTEFFSRKLKIFWFSFSHFSISNKTSFQKFSSKILILVFSNPGKKNNIFFKIY